MINVVQFIINACNYKHFAYIENENKILTQFNPSKMNFYCHMKEVLKLTNELKKHGVHYSFSKNNEILIKSRFLQSGKEKIA